MNTPARFVGNKVKLATALGVSRTTFYAFARLPGAPAPRADGRHDVCAWRKFLSSHASKIKDLSEGDALKIALLKVRLEREQLELEELNNAIREQITRDVSTACFRAMEFLKMEVERLPHDLSPRFSGLEPMGIFKLFERELNQCFRQASEALGKLEAQSKRKKTKEASNVLEFKAAAAY